MVINVGIISECNRYAIIIELFIYKEEIVLDKVKMAYRDEDSILEQIYQSKYFRPTNMKILGVITKH